MLHARAQSVRWRQGPLQRRLGLADVHVDTTPGPVRMHAAHRDADEALTAVDREIRLARRARASAGPERWMLHRPSSGPSDADPGTSIPGSAPYPADSARGRDG